jgi:small subunit ribosomal protein S9
VFLRPGHRDLTINSRDLRGVLPHRSTPHARFKRRWSHRTADKFDILATVAGGGVSVRPGAVRLGIARALVDLQRSSCASRLKSEGLLTRDCARQGRKKYGMAGARKRFQFSKLVTTAHDLERMEDAWPRSR